MQKDRITYDAPAITIVEVKAVGMMCSSTIRVLGLTSGAGSNAIEDRIDGGNWGGNDWN